MTGKKTAATFYIAVVCAIAMLALWPRLKKRSEEAEEKAAGNEKEWEIIIEDGEKIYILKKFDQNVLRRLVVAIRKENGVETFTAKVKFKKRWDMIPRPFTI